MDGESLPRDGRNECHPVVFRVAGVERGAANRGPLEFQVYQGAVNPRGRVPGHFHDAIREEGGD